MGTCHLPVLLLNIRRTDHCVSINALEDIEASSFLSRDLNKATSERCRVRSPLRVIPEHQILPLSRSQIKVNSLKVKVYKYTK